MQHQQLIEVIAAALSDNATKEQKQSGVQACRTIITALDCEPGQPLVLPGAPRPHVLAGVSIDQVLELAIARLSMLAKDREQVTQSPSTKAADSTAPSAPKAFIAPGLRVPMVSSKALRPAPAVSSQRTRATTMRRAPISGSSKP